MLSQEAPRNPNNPAPSSTGHEPGPLSYPMSFSGDFISLNDAPDFRPTSRSDPRFALGQTVITSNAASVLPDHEVVEALRRHVRGDWGTLDAEDWAANERALVEGGRLLSAYNSKCGIRFWIITEADRSVTTVLLPEDY
jgi:hypothetical protein